MAWCLWYYGLLLSQTRIAILLGSFVLPTEGRNRMATTVGYKTYLNDFENGFDNDQTDSITVSMATKCFQELAQ